MNLEEQFDIFDDQMNKIGTAARREVHAHGLWHQTFQCWIVSELHGEKWLLFQMRHPDKDTFPSLLDISCAGHLLAGEKVEDGVRELEEELGLAVTFDSLIPCGLYRQEQFIAADKTDRELCHVFVLREDKPLHEYRLQADEVTGLYRIALKDVNRLARGEEQLVIQAAGVEPDKDGVLQPVERTFTHSDFVPHGAAYYELVLRGVEKLEG